MEIETAAAEAEERHASELARVKADAGRILAEKLKRAARDAVQERDAAVAEAADHAHTDVRRRLEARLAEIRDETRQALDKDLQELRSDAARRRAETVERFGLLADESSSTGTTDVSEGEESDPSATPV